ncbi:MAG TPA: carboxypeptidase M32 [Candidatus Cryosericum sp.]|nr:carboxypeptidase M32 [Candidatus Cryosericum sp.]
MDIKEFYDYYREIAQYQNAAALVEWDMRTKMPPKAAADRSMVAGKLGRTAFEMMTSPRMGAFVEFFNRSSVASQLNETDRRNVALVTKQYRKVSAIPADRFEKFMVACSRGEHVWQEAKAKSDFGMFLPCLEEIIAFEREFVEYEGYEQNRYDALLDDYEPSMTTAELQTIIDGLKQELVPFIRQLQEDGTRPDTSFLAGTFPVSEQAQLSRDVLTAMTYDFDAGRIDETEHPFTTSLGAGDVRVTTHYYEHDLMSALFSTMHEGGHGLYEQGISEEYHWMPLHRAASMGVHESQSRTWENLVGRSEAFWRFYYPRLQGRFAQFRDVPVEDFYKAINVVEPSLIRIEADEVTYNLHIMLRFEIEEALINGRVQAADLPGFWNAKMKEYLGVEPTDDAHGVMQDVHWAGGMFGYFPSYMLGNLYAAQFFAAAREAIPNLDEELAAGHLSVLREWQRSNIHACGALYDPKDLLVKVTGKPLDYHPFMDQVRAKYGRIYGIEEKKRD